MKTIGAVIAVVLLSTGLYLGMTRSGMGDNRVEIPAVTPVNGPITRATVAQHNSLSSCWSIIDESVYDLTAWISQHPGGERAIVSLCGTDGSDAFRDRHGDSQTQANILVNYKIGQISQ